MSSAGSCEYTRKCVCENSSDAHVVTFQIVNHGNLLPTLIRTMGYTGPYTVGKTSAILCEASVGVMTTFVFFAIHNALPYTKTPQFFSSQTVCCAGFYAQKFRSLAPCITFTSKMASTRCCVVSFQPSHCAICDVSLMRLQINLARQVHSATAQSR